MSKELEALERYHNLDVLKENENGLVLDDKTEYDTIKQALQRLEEIDNSNPTEALEYLEHIKKDDFNMIITTYPPLQTYNGITKDEMFNKIEQNLLKSQETEKENAYIEKILQVIKQEFKLELYDICKRRLELSTNANRDNLEKIINWLKEA